MNLSLVSVLAFVTFNLPVAVFLFTVPFSASLGDVLKEKAPDGSATDATSYSRVTGALGAIVVTSFFWATGNVVLNLALGDKADDIASLLKAVWVFFLIGSALFLPYAFNQLKTIFPLGATAAAALAQANAGAALAQPQAVQPGGPAPASLVIANLSTVTSSQLTAALDAIQIQINRDFGREWGITTKLSSQQVTLPLSADQIDASHDAIIYLGNEAQDPYGGVDDLLGYHASNSPGVPYGFVYLDACALRKQDWSVTLSHEILELLVDPQTTGRAPGPDPTNLAGPDALFEMEVCDPTETDTYTIGTVSVSNFVTKRYFGLNGESTATNFCRLPLSPFSARPGGYAQYHNKQGLQVVNGGSVSQGQLAARALMGMGRRSGRRSTTPA
ncbi:hypothetical protein AB4Y42_11510 [Paraburkholderia sp. EG286B]|uniref:hypothetical protein n=1 Tax=Paraburkholderia sp. EG286B TaxID=3237011 RepID=UPI0034D23CE2